MTNLEKINEVIKETFGCEVDKKKLRRDCVCDYINCEGYSCCNCGVIKNHQEEFWNAEYKPGSLSSIVPKDPRISYEEEKKFLDGKGGK